MPRNSLRYKNEKGQISAYKLKRKSLSFNARELLREIIKRTIKKYKGHPPKITNVARC